MRAVFVATGGGDKPNVPDDGTPLRPSLLLRLDPEGDDRRASANEEGGDGAPRSNAITSDRLDKLNRTRPPSILVVDDDPAVREAIASVLRDERFVVATAGNGRAALNLMESGFRPSAVLLDLWMPELDGAQTLDAMKSRPHLADIPVIVITAVVGSPLDESVQRANRVMKKPINLDELLAAVAEHTTPSAPPAE